MPTNEILALIVGAVVTIAIIVYMIVNEKEKLLKWLENAVLFAEKELGKETGQAKLRLVWEWFCEQFPIISTVLPFKVFGALVDSALETLNSMIDKNSKIKAYVRGDSKND